MLYVSAKRPSGCRRNVQNSSAKRPTRVGETSQDQKVCRRNVCRRNVCSPILTGSKLFNISEASESKDP